MKKTAFLILALLATVLLSLGLSWLLRLASKPSNVDVVVGLGGSAGLFYLYWEVIKRCVRSFRREMPINRTNPNPTAHPKELNS